MRQPRLRSVPDAPCAAAGVRAGRLSRFGAAGGAAARRVLTLAVAVGMVLAVVVACGGVAAAAPHRQVPAVGRGGAGSGMTLAQAPAGLQAAVRRALGGPAAPAGPVVPQAKDRKSVV